MVVGNKKYGLQWRIEIEEPWVVHYHGEKANWIHINREEMVYLWKKWGDVETINIWLGMNIDSDSFCVVENKFSELDFM